MAPWSGEAAMMMPAGVYPAFRPIPEGRSLSILGSTGSIGTSTLDLVARHRDRFRIDVLAAKTNVALLASQARAFSAELAVVADESCLGELEDRLAGTGIGTAGGDQALIEAASRPVDMLMASIVGSAGLAPTLAAVRRGTTVALANKECLVSAGDLFMREIAAAGGVLLPVDSEHSAIFQVLDPAQHAHVSRIVLTASGGPFRDWDLAAMRAATPAQALRHPNWEMGPKLTIDSATMMNKGLELIEAHHLFAMPVDRLDVVVHPQSVIHSMVEYADGSVLAQMGSPDMRTPIAYALAWPDRMAAPTARLDLRMVGQLTFEAVDDERFPAIGLALECLRSGAGAPTVLNAANEVAVAAFLGGRIGFLEIVDLVRRTVETADRDGFLGEVADLDAVAGLDARARELAAAFVAQSRYGGW
jgi:1-deoxy-D-xylulose-5-phosphate reductoisomerase